MGISSYLETNDSTCKPAYPNCSGTGSSGNGGTKAPEQRFASVEELKRALKLLLLLLTPSRPRRLLVTLQSLAHYHQDHKRLEIPYFLNRYHQQ